MDTHTREEADRRGQRASWIAAGLFVVGVAVVFARFGGWYDERRYLELREHESRRQRFEIERIRQMASSTSPCAISLVSVEGVDLARWMTSNDPLARSLGLAGRGDAAVSPSTLDSLRTIGKVSWVVNWPGTTTEWVSALARQLRTGGIETAIVSGTPLTEGERLVVGGGFEHIHDGVPDLTEFLREGDAAWVCAEAARFVDRPRERRAFVWQRQVEPTPPHLLQRRFAEWGSAGGEIVSVDHYVGRFFAYAGAGRCTTSPVLLVEGAVGQGAVFPVLAVHVSLPDTITVERVAAALSIDR
jgi:hypothetical protein